MVRRNAGSVCRRDSVITCRKIPTCGGWRGHSTTLRRDVIFDGAEWLERADDRIPHGERREVAWQGPAPAGVTRVVGRIRVRPDAFYERFFAELLAQTPTDDPARPSLEEALARTRASPYDLWTREESLSRQPKEDGK